MGVGATADGPGMEEGHALLRPSRVARLLDLSRSAVYQKIAAGEIPAVRLGRSIRVPASAIREIVERRRDDAD